MKIHLVQRDRTYDMDNGETLENRLLYSACGRMLNNEPGETVNYTDDVDEVTCKTCKQTDFFEEKMDMLEYV